MNHKLSDRQFIEILVDLLSCKRAFSSIVEKLPDPHSPSLSMRNVMLQNFEPLAQIFGVQECSHSTLVSLETRVISILYYTLLGIRKLAQGLVLKVPYFWTSFYQILVLKVL